MKPTVTVTRASITDSPYREFRAKIVANITNPTGRNVRVETIFESPDDGNEAPHDLYRTQLCWWADDGDDVEPFYTSETSGFDHDYDAPTDGELLRVCRKQAAFDPELKLIQLAKDTPHVDELLASVETEAGAPLWRIEDQLVHAKQQAQDGDREACHRAINAALRMIE